jgi:putative RecB family exonuclease
MYLRSGETITVAPSEQSVRFLTTRTTAVWKAVERACTTADFRPRQGPLCKSCAFQQWCPAFGGDPDLAKVEAPIAFGRLAAA